MILIYIYRKFFHKSNVYLFMFELLSPRRLKMIGLLFLSSHKSKVWKSTSSYALFVVYRYWNVCECSDFKRLLNGIFLKFLRFPIANIYRPKKLNLYYSIIAFMLLF